MVNITRDAYFSVECTRVNIHRINWVLKVSIDGGSTWTLKTWKHKPSVKKIQKAAELARRCFVVSAANEFNIATNFKVSTDTNIQHTE